ncbi:cytochrome P450 [Flammula alnicola]|nr:cytochrome P450 [Flammula alnicola]
MHSEASPFCEGAAACARDRSTWACSEPTFLTALKLKLEGSLLPGTPYLWLFALCFCTVAVLQVIEYLSLDTVKSNAFASVTPSVLAALVAAVAYMVLYSQHKGLPPGPRQTFFGSRKAVSALPPWKKFTALYKLYGPIVSFYQGQTGRRFVISVEYTKTLHQLYPKVVGTIKAVTDLLEKREVAYTPLIHAGMSVEAAQNYKPLQSIESKIPLHDFLQEKDRTRYASHLRRFAVSIVLCVGYGRRVQSLDDSIIVANQKTDECLVSTPGRSIVESWQILLKLPLFLQWFRREPEAQRERDTELYLSLVNHDFGLNDLETAYALSAPFGAGVGTTLVTLDVFFRQCYASFIVCFFNWLCSGTNPVPMLHYPEIMRKAQAEIDSVVGSSRLPDFDDDASMPYVQAIIKETMWFGPLHALHLI